MTNFPLLSAITFLPSVGALFILLFIRGANSDAVSRNAKWAALWTSMITLGLAGYAWFLFDPTNDGFQLIDKLEWLPQFSISYTMGVDGISLFFVVLSALLTPICILSSWEAIASRVKEYMVAFLVLETFMLGMFSALDFMLFYIFFEAVLIPMFIIIGVWGGDGRVYAAFKFFLYTLAGSVLMLLALLTIYLEAGTTDIPTILENTQFTSAVQIWLWLAFFASFAVKVPMWPVHTWLPDAHVQAPTAGSVILAGILLKMGAYGFIRFSVPMLPEATVMFTPLIFTLSVIAVIYTSLVALAQSDMKKLIAYSSVAHMGFVTLGIFSLTQQGLQGALFQMLSHGVVSGALFLCVGIVYDRLHTREIARYGGLAENMPKYALIFMVFMLASVGLPGTGGFVGEFLVLLGTFRVNTWAAALAATGVVLGAAYMLYLYRRVIFGPLDKPDLKLLPDLSWREISMFAPLIVLALWMGIYPATFLNPMEGAVEKVIATHKQKLAQGIEAAKHSVAGRD